MGKKKEKSCGAVIVTRDNKFILIKHLAGHWDFPKGHMEDGESEEQTALREVKEETGLDIKLIEGFREVIHYNIKEEINKEVVFFLGEAKDNEVKIQVEEIQDFAILSYDEALDIITYKNNREVLNKANKFLKENS